MPDDTEGLGPEPRGRAARDHQRAAGELHAAQRLLGRAPDRAQGLER